MNNTTEMQNKVEAQLDKTIEDMEQLIEMDYMLPVHYVSEVLGHMKSILKELRNEPDGYGARFDGDYIAKNIKEHARWINRYAKEVESQEQMDKRHAANNKRYEKREKWIKENNFEQVIYHNVCDNCGKGSCTSGWYSKNGKVFCIACIDELYKMKHK
jgi:formylmethanofuran dehydrogenase subunit E